MTRVCVQVCVESYKSGTFRVFLISPWCRPFHGCYVLSCIIIIIIIIIQKICSAHISTLLGAQGANSETPHLFHDKCPGFFYAHYTAHGTYSFTSHPKDEAIVVKCLAQGHKRRDWPGRDSNPHSDNTRTWVQCTRPLGHDTPERQIVLKHATWIKLCMPSPCFGTLYTCAQLFEE